MKDYKEDFKKLWQNERTTMALMIFNFLLSLGLMIFSFTKLNPGSAVIKIGYGDIGGYRDGSWVDLIAFSLLAILFGIMHNFIALKIFHRRGAGMAKFFIFITTVLIIGAFIVLIRLTQEG